MAQYASTVPPVTEASSGNDDQQIHLTGAAKRKSNTLLDEHTPSKKCNVAETQPEVEPGHQDDNDNWEEQVQDLLMLSYLEKFNQTPSGLESSDKSMGASRSNTPSPTKNEETDPTDGEEEQLESGSSSGDEKKSVSPRNQKNNILNCRRYIQKRKDVREEARIEGAAISHQIEQIQSLNSIKEKHANFAIELQKQFGVKGVEAQRYFYEAMKFAKQARHSEVLATHENIRMKAVELTDAQKKYEKAVRDVSLGQGAGYKTLGSRKTRAKEDLEWCELSLQILVSTHKLHQEYELASLVNGYVFRVVPGAALLLHSLPKDSIDKKVGSDKMPELESFRKFVADYCS